MRPSCNLTAIEKEWKNVASTIRNLITEPDRKLQPDSLESFLQTIQTVFYQAVDSASQRAGLKYLDLMWKILLEDIPHCLDKNTELRVLIGLSRTHDVAGNWETALDMYDKAKNLARELNQKELEADILRWIGHVLRKRGKWTEAIENNKASLKVCLDIQYLSGAAYAYNNTGTIHLELGELEEAREYFNKALSLAQQHGEVRLKAQISNNMGIIASIQGDFENAILSYHEALVGYESEGDVQGMAQTFYNQAICYEQKNDDSVVAKHLERSCELAKDTGERNLLAMIYLMRAKLSSKHGDLSTALSFKDRALETFLDLNDQCGVADSFRIEGIIYHRQKDYTKSESSFKKSIELNKELSNYLGLAEAYLDYGLFLMERKDGRNEEILRESQVIFSRFGAHKKIEHIDDIIGGNRAPH